MLVEVGQRLASRRGRDIAVAKLCLPPRLTSPPLLQTTQHFEDGVGVDATWVPDQTYIRTITMTLGTHFTPDQPLDDALCFYYPVVLCSLT